MRLLLYCVKTVVVDMLRDEMKKHTESEGFIIVGFPRNISQVKSLVGKGPFTNDVATLNNQR